MTSEIGAHIKVVQHPNPNMRTFHVVREVGDIDHMYGFGTDNFYGLSGRKKNPGDYAKILAKRLSELPGVTHGHLKQYDISVGIGEAFNWRDIGPLVLGEIIRSIYPEVDGKTIEISVSIGWGYHVRPRSFGFMNDEDDGHRTRYVDTVDHETVPVNLGIRPRFDIELMLDKNALIAAQEQAEAQKVFE
jgi:hypothetical protein